MRDPASMKNEAFETFYRADVVPEAEWDEFMTSMRTALPTAMRLNGSLPDAVVDAVRTCVLDGLRTCGEEQVRLLPFVPRGLGVQSTVSRGELKRDAANKATKQVIAALNDLGYITRQEAVSMIPPLLLDAQPGERVLDMCAAPGSKTTQLLEAVMGPNGGDHPNGCVVANEINAGRMDVLSFQTGRLPRAHAHLIITQQDAMQFPLPTRAEDKFDRVLCDVMCSGDGTLRKSMDMWSRWTTLQGPELHFAQCRTLIRGMSLCKKGGVVVYSTCSLNPIEDEAVISHCIAASKGTFRIADTSALLPELRRTPGRTSWRFMPKSLREEFTTWAEASAHNTPGKGFQIRESMLPSAAAAEQGLEHTWRVLPHHQDTGGFFIAKLECLDDFPGSIAAPKANREQELRPLSEGLRTTVLEALDLDAASFPIGSIYVRSESSREQKFYYLADGAAAALAVNHARVSHAGAKVFESTAKYSNSVLRFATDGITTLARLLPPRYFADMPPELVLEAAGVDGAYPLQKFLSAAGKQRDELPAKHIIVRTTLPNGLGEMLFPGELSLIVRIKILPRQVTLIRHALGLPIVVDEPNTAKAGGDGDGDGDAAESADDDGVAEDAEGVAAEAEHQEEAGQQQ